MDLGDPDIRIIRLRYPGRCSCGAVLDVGLRAAYDDARRRVICADCLNARKRASVSPPASPPAGVAGASAVREYKRRVAKHDEETASMKWGLRRFVRRHTPPPSSTRVWLKGAAGERRVADVIDALAPRDVYALHDCGVPRSRANIDHVAIAASGVYVVDAKNYPGAALALRREGGWGRPVQETLVVRGRQRNDLLAGLARQLFSVEEALHGDPELARIPVRGVLCFLGANWPLFPLNMSVAGTPVVGPKGLRRQLLAEGPVSAEARYAAFCRLAQQLPSN